MWADTFGGPQYHVCGGSDADPAEILPFTQTQGPAPADSDAGGFVSFDINLPEWETNVPTQKKIDVSYKKSTSGPTQSGMVTCAGCEITLSNSQTIPVPASPKTDKDYARDDINQDAIPLAKVYC